MTLEIRRLHLASLQGLDGSRWPVHGFVVLHPGGAALVDTGVGGPQEVLDDWRVVNRTVADALAEIDLSPADIGLVINTHLHFDHCGQNAVFKHAPFYVQRAELDRARRPAPGLHADPALLPGLRVIPPPGHTAGHQCVVVSADDGAFDLLIGDAAYTPRVYADPASDKLPPGQASDLPAWRDSLRRVQALGPDRVHFCHHTDVIHH